jgi:hypothetical protein
MTGWEELLHHFAEVPRENGTPALQDAASYLAAVLQATEAQVEHLPYLEDHAPLRGLHSSKDHRGHVSVHVLEGTLQLLLTAMRRADAQGLLGKSHEAR